MDVQADSDTASRRPSAPLLRADGLRAAVAALILTAAQQVVSRRADTGESIACVGDRPEAA